MSRSFASRGTRSRSHPSDGFSRFSVGGATLFTTAIIENILKSAKDGKIGELILSTLVSLNDKSWKDVHPEHLKILLNSFKEAGFEKFFKDVIIEIFEESKII